MADFAGRIERLAAAPHRVFWRECFQRNACAKDRPLETVCALGAEAEECGWRYGHESAAAGRTPRALCEENGLEVQELAMPPLPEMEIFALFEPPSTVSVRTDLCIRCDQFIKDSGMNAFLGEFRCVDVLLAHEFFHFLEERDSGTIFTRTYREFRGIFKRELPPLSEIAAMGFAQEVLGLKWSPFLLDCVLLGMSDMPSALAMIKRLERSAAEYAWGPSA